VVEKGYFCPALLQQIVDGKIERSHAYQKLVGVAYGYLASRKNQIQKLSIVICMLVSLLQIF